MPIIAMIEASAAPWSAHSDVHRCCCERVAVLSTRCRAHHLRLFFLLSTVQKLTFLFWLAVYIALLYLKHRASPGPTLLTLLLLRPISSSSALPPPPPPLSPPPTPILPPPLSTPLTKYSSAICRRADGKIAEFNPYSAGFNVGISVSCRTDAFRSLPLL